METPHAVNRRNRASNRLKVCEHRTYSQPTFILATYACKCFVRVNYWRWYQVVLILFERMSLYIPKLSPAKWHRLGKPMDSLVDSKLVQWLLTYGWNCLEHHKNKIRKHLNTLAGPAGWGWVWGGRTPPGMAQTPLEKNDKYYKNFKKHIHKKGYIFISDDR